MAQMERDLISERTSEALRFKISKGEPVGSPPSGYEAKGKKHSELKEELNTVRNIKRLKRRKLSLRQIANRLNEQGIPAKRGRRWYVRMCSDNELISKYYEIDSKLQIVLDELNIAQGGATREAISNIGSKYKIYTGGISIAFAKKKVEHLRKMRAILLTEIYKRGLKIPK